MPYMEIQGIIIKQPKLKPYEKTKFKGQAPNI